MDPITATAQTIQTVGQSADAIHTMTLAAIGLAFAMPLQSFIEHAIAEKPWMNGAAKTLKPLLPTIISGVIGYVATRFGVSPADAMTVAASLTGATHLVNQSGLAAEVPSAPKP